MVYITCQSLNVTSFLYFYINNNKSNLFLVNSCFLSAFYSLVLVTLMTLPLEFL
jgi:hypothetical protein